MTAKDNDRHAELVSASTVPHVQTPPLRTQPIGKKRTVLRSEWWMLKRVQHDEGG
jgi:hypothetical protein